MATEVVLLEEEKKNNYKKINGVDDATTEKINSSFTASENQTKAQAEADSARLLPTATGAKRKATTFASTQRV